MNISRKMKAVLFLSGAIASTIGGLILTAPEMFYASYGISVGGDPALLNETRASGGLLFALGALVIAGAFVPALTVTSGLVAVLIYLSYGLSRLLGFALDGWSNAGLVDAAIVEIAIGLVVCAVVVCEKGRTLWRPSQR